MATGHRGRPSAQTAAPCRPTAERALEERPGEMADCGDGAPGEEEWNSSVETKRAIVMVRELQSGCLFKVLHKVLRKCSAAQHGGKESGPASFAGLPSIGLSIDEPWNGGE